MGLLGEGALKKAHDIEHQNNGIVSHKTHALPVLIGTFAQNIETEAM